MMPIVYVAALTYRRPEDLTSLLGGLAALGLPTSWDVRFLIVDNDPEGSARSIVQSQHSRFSGRLHYVTEADPGIPAARNRALRMAKETAAELLCFLDDDEIPQADWLEVLIAHRTMSGAHLIGGPLRRTAPPGRLTWKQALMVKSLIARRSLAECGAAVRASSSQPVPVYTSNWLCDIDAARKHDLWFDEKMRFSGGSDAAFYKEARAKGLKTSWCAEAIVSEPITHERLGIGYQFRRSRDQAIVDANLRKEPVLRSLSEQVPRGLAGAVLLVLPLIGVASFATGLHLVATAFGHLSYLRGKQSSLYARATEVS
jgi:succinoglycan biosynthesis protein ExoM